MYVLGYYNYEYYVHYKTDALRYNDMGYNYKIIKESHDIFSLIKEKDALNLKIAEVPHAAHGLSSMA